MELEMELSKGCPVGGRLLTPGCRVTTASILKQESMGLSLPFAIGLPLLTEGARVTWAALGRRLAPSYLLFYLDLKIWQFIPCVIYAMNAPTYLAELLLHSLFSEASISPFGQ